MRLATGSKCKFCNTGVMRSNFRVPDTSSSGTCVTVEIEDVMLTFLRSSTLNAVSFVVCDNDNEHDTVILTQGVDD